MRGWRSPKSASIRSFVIISIQTKSRMAAPGAVFLSSPSNIVGEWLSLVEHLVRDQGVGGSNPLSPTNYQAVSSDYRSSCFVDSLDGLRSARYTGTCLM